MIVQFKRQLDLFVDAAHIKEREMIGLKYH